MAKPNPNVAALRAEVFKKQRNATRKVARLRRQNAVDLKGTEHDPRVAHARINRMNTRQLNALSRKLDTFTSRNKQYKPGSLGAIITSAQFNYYKYIENKYNQAGIARYEAVKGLTDPNRGHSVESRDQTTARAGMQKDYRPYDPISRASTDFPSAQALQTVIKEMQRRVYSDYSKTEIDKSRKWIDKALETRGDEDNRKLVNTLNDEEFDLMFHYLGYKRDLNLFGFGTPSGKTIGDTTNDLSAAIENQSNSVEVADVIEWIKNNADARQAVEQLRTPTKKTKPQRKKN